jgi:hypothetical protein
MGGGVVPAMVNGGILKIVARRAASRAAPSALRVASASSFRCACSRLRCVLAGSLVLVGRGCGPRPPPRRLPLPWADAVLRPDR